MKQRPFIASFNELILYYSFILIRALIIRYEKCTYSVFITCQLCVNEVEQHHPNQFAEAPLKSLLFLQTYQCRSQVQYIYTYIYDGRQDSNEFCPISTRTSYRIIEGVLFTICLARVEKNRKRDIHTHKNNVNK